MSGPENDLETLMQRLGHRFENRALLVEALTHPSAIGRRPRQVKSADGGAPVADYNRLEFLGDRVLGVVIAEYLFGDDPGAPAGRMALRFNRLVCQEALATVAREVEIGPFMILSPGERQTGGAEKPAILADCCEAIIAAMYLDGGLDVARDFIMTRWAEQATEADNAARDAKTALQEWAHRAGIDPPDYEIVSRDGPAHNPLFTVVLRLQDQEPASGRGRSKRSAEQAAAEVFMDRVS